jgi:hypothetical protein
MAAMAPESIELAIRDLIKQLQARLEQAITIANEAQTCIEASSPMEALKLALNTALPIYEATLLLDAVGLMQAKVAPT